MEDDAVLHPADPPTSKTPKKRFVGRRTAEAMAKRKQQKESADGSGNIEETTVVLRQTRPTARTPRLLNQIPADILQDAAINEAVDELLPPNYAFEMHKTIHRIRSSQAKRVALQFPEGLLLFATTISDILAQFCPGTETLIMGDVTYGACCIDDYTARALDCDLLVHYAHSCLVPLAKERMPTLYVFVDISIDTDHLVATLARNFSPGTRIAMVGTIQFNSTIHAVRSRLEQQSRLHIHVPQIAPLSKGEILGCTAPEMPAAQARNHIADPVGNGANPDDAVDLILYLGDGRFHLESAMIANPSIPSYRYDPYSRKLTREHYDHSEMRGLRSSAVATARDSTRCWGLILGSLGRQGNPHTLALIEERLRERQIPFVSLLLSEIFPAKLARFSRQVDCWVQVACPRLSIDWGYAFDRPLLTPHEALVALGVNSGWEAGTAGAAYPMDYYAKEGLGRTGPAHSTRTKS